MTTSLFPLRAAEFKIESTSESEGVNKAPPLRPSTFFRIPKTLLLLGQTGTEGVGVAFTSDVNQTAKDAKTERGTTDLIILSTIVTSKVECLYEERCHHRLTITTTTKKAIFSTCRLFVGRELKWYELYLVP